MLRLLALSIVLVAAAYAAVFLPGDTPVWAPWLLAIGSNGVIMTLMALGAMRRDHLPRSLGWTFIGLFVLCAGAFLVALALPPGEGAGGTLLLGLPLRTAIVLYGIGVVPIAVLPFAYALTFESSTLSEDDLARVREASAAVRAAERSA
ncbi:MAG: hypothetical protein JWL60_2236 [Gemmatimonadetes bacterium]|nr:hypothetical protein [Gemmatimonadota bacterium]